MKNRIIFCLAFIISLIGFLPDQVLAETNRRDKAPYFKFFPHNPELGGAKYTQTSTSKESRSDKIRWLHRAARALRGGVGILPSDDIEALSKLSRLEASKKLSQHPRFGDTVIAFLLFFKGASLNIRDGLDLLNPRLVDHPDVIAASQSLVLGTGSIDPFFRANYPLYFGNNFKTYDGMTLNRINTENARVVHDVAHKWITLAASANPSSMCIDYPADWGNLVRVLGLPDFLDFRARFMWLWPISYYCFFGGPLPDVANTVQVLKTKLVDLLGERNHVSFPLNDVADFLPLDADALGLLGWSSINRVHQNESYFFKKYTNSSTNYNRKRAAYILKHYFCDDLIPVGVEQGDAKSHTVNGHSTDPQCLSCHYKLDPMAGFFRHVGNAGQAYTGDVIVFDDAVALSLPDYLDAWRNPDHGSSRPWDVGYIRSRSDESMNHYGVALDDIWTVISAAPEIKQCLSKRAFEFFNSADQMVDPGFLAKLAENTDTSTAPPSGKTVADLLKIIVASETFANEDPDPLLCYDRPEGSNAEIPCAVSFDLQNCVGCHRNGSPLDFTEVLKDEMGKVYFSHKDRSGQQLSRSSSFAKIADRLSTSDGRQRMPLGMYMDDLARARLLNWFQREAN